MANPNIQIDDLKNTWVVFKRIKKQNYYHRGNHYSQCSTNARHAEKYQTKEAAIADQVKLNEGRKAYKFKVESAEKHFVSNWQIRYDQYQKNVTIKNEPIAFKRVATNSTVVSQTLNDKKDNIIKNITDDLTRVTNEHSLIEQRYQAALQQAEQQRKDNLRRAAEQAAQLLNLKSWVETTDLDTNFVLKHQTETDKKAYILFGRKESGV